MMNWPDPALTQARQMARFRLPVAFVALVMDMDAQSPRGRSDGQRLRPLRPVRVGWTGIHVQLASHLLAERGLGQHAFNGPFEHRSRLAAQDLPDGFRLQP